MKRHMYLLLVLVVLAWGLSWPVNKMGLEFMPPLWFASMRLLFGTITMFILVTINRKLILPQLRDLPIIFAIGIFQIGVFILFINLGLKVQPTGRSAILVYTTPLWVMLPAIYIFKERSTLLKWIGFILGMVGVFIMLSPWEMDWSNSHVLLGTVFLLIAAISFSISILCARHMTWTRTPFELVPWQLLLATILVLVIAVIFSPHPAIQWTMTASFSVLYTAVVATALGFWGMSVLSKELPSTITSLGFLGVPVSGVIFSIILLHEPLPLLTFIAMIFIIVGLLCVVIGERNKSD